MKEEKDYITGADDRYVLENLKTASNIWRETWKKKTKQ